MNRILAMAGAVALLSGGMALAQSADDAFGVWLNTRNNAHNEFYKCGEDLCGKLIRVVDGQKTDDKNPDPAKRNRPIEGLVYIENFKRAGTNKWQGKSYNRMDGKLYPATLTVKSKNALDLTACGPPGCVTFKMTRLK